jgi:hypothetical protein
MKDTYLRSRSKDGPESDESFYKCSVPIQEEQERGPREPSLPYVVNFVSERYNVVVKQDHCTNF